MTRFGTTSMLGLGTAMLLALASCNPATGMSAEPVAPAEQAAEPVRDEPLSPPSQQAVEAGAVNGAGVAPPVVEPRTYSVIGVGDIMMGSDWPQPGMDPRVAPDADPALVLGDDLATLFREADVVFGNYEGTIHTSSENAKECRDPEVCFVFRSPPFHATYLARAGFTLMSNANNHARDFGETGRRRTYENLTAAGIAVAGGDVEGMRIGTQTAADGRRFALVAFGHNPGLLMVHDYGRLAEMVRQADAQADVVIVSCHIGAEGARYSRVTRATEMFLEEDRGNPYRFAHAAVDAGADIVFCHGPHVPRAVEVYRGRFIAYSLGNFWTYGRFNVSGANGLAPVARLEVDGEGALVSAEIVSAIQARPGGPRLDSFGGAARRIAELTALDMVDTSTRLDAAGRVVWQP